jgi:hypothetical protein
MDIWGNKYEKWEGKKGGITVRRVNYLQYGQDKANIFLTAGIKPAT